VITLKSSPKLYASNSPCETGTDGQLLNSNRYGAARGAYREVQERHAEIQKIEKTLTELAQMFSEMAMLVEQQDETIVNVEGQAQGVDSDVKAGYVKLKSRLGR
jgi:t-SNARE complex subunit (syntaxin)